MSAPFRAGSRMARMATAAWVLVVVLAYPGVASANAGVPMLGIALPGFGLMLLPIIALETGVIARSLRMAPRAVVWPVALSNLASTLLGIPLTWALLVLLQMVTGGGGAIGMGTIAGRIIAVTWQAPWMMPYESDLYWMIPTALLVLLVPFFFASWFMEYGVSRLMLRASAGKPLFRAVRTANIASYAMLVVVVLVYLGVNVATHGS